MRSSPACIVYGTCGSGKSTICKKLLSDGNFPHVFVSGVGFSNAKSFLITAWDSIKDALRSYRTELQEKYDIVVQLGLSLTKRITKFTELALSLGAILDSLLDSSSLQLLPCDQCFYIVLDDLHHICAQDNLFASNLLNLSQVPAQYNLNVSLLVLIWSQFLYKTA